MVALFSLHSAVVLLFAVLLVNVDVSVDGFVQKTSGWHHRNPSSVVASTNSVPVGRSASFLMLKNRVSKSNDDENENENEVDDNGVANKNMNSISNTDMDRRRALTATGMAMMSLWLGDTFGADNIASQWAMSAASAAEDSGTQRTVLITGCNSGIGFEAARILARKGDKLILACRTQEKAEEAARRLLAETSTATLIPAECDLTSLESIRKFVATTSNSLDVVCYNAGIALSTDGDIERTADGFEKTIGTNHLGHFYLHHLLQPKIATAAGRVVITASSVHDPESPGGKQGKTATLGNLEGFSRDGSNFEMVDGNPYNGDKAYKDSKLCNILFCRELQRRLEAGGSSDTSSTTKNIVVNAFSPGLITSTGFFRNQNPVFSSLFNVAATNIFKVAETPEFGGAALAYMTTVDSVRGEFYDSPPGTSYKYSPDDNYNGAFGKEFTVTTVSKEGQEDAKAKTLWTLSEKLVGI